MNQIIKDCAAEHERRLENQERIDEAARTTVNNWKKLAKNSHYEFDLSKDIERLVIDHIADPYQFAYMALLAHLSGNGTDFLESQLEALALCEVNHE